MQRRSLLKSLFAAPLAALAGKTVTSEPPRGPSPLQGIAGTITHNGGFSGNAHPFTVLYYPPCDPDTKRQVAELLEKYHSQGGVITLPASPEWQIIGVDC